MEVEGQLLSEDYGKDLTSVQNLLKKHKSIEADITAHQVSSGRYHRPSGELRPISPPIG